MAALIGAEHVVGGIVGGLKRGRRRVVLVDDERASRRRGCWALIFRAPSLLHRRSPHYHLLQPLKTLYFECRGAKEEEAQHNTPRTLFSVMPGFNLFYQIVVYTPEVSVSNPGDAKTNYIVFFTQICLNIKYLQYKIL